ncbi:coiled-coil domain-containing protein 168 [Arvicola amphibius]|uniref:coiled-coil domain-containing protein 168 n=1 Tax=Arvicola amphibius TaxID=1047088 RepID=UPI0018E31934|nr:coiled-coil domain-containing protein 168 [Arvicola amphibius]
MSKIYHFFKNIAKPILDENTFCKIWDFLNDCIFNNVWIVTLIIIFLGVTFEIVLIRTFEFFKKKLELWENGSSCSQKQNEDIFPKEMAYAIESWSISHTSSMERVETFSRSIPSSPPSEEIRYNTIEMTISSDEWEHHRSHFCESRASSGGTNTPLPMFHPKVKNIFANSFHRKDPPGEYQTVPFSSNNLCPTMKTNGTKTSLPDALNLQRAFKFTRAKDLHMAPSPPVHFFLPSDQIRRVEENIRRKISVNAKARSWREAECLYPRAQEPSIHSHYSHKEGVIPGEARTTFPHQSAMQHQLIREAQCASQTQPFIHDQDSASSQPGSSEPAYFLRPPFSTGTQNSFRAQETAHENKDHPFNHTLCIAETEYSTKDIESAEHFSKTQNSVYFNVQNKSNNLVKGQNRVFQNAEFLSLNSNLLAEAMAQHKVAPGQQPLASLESNQYDAYGSVPLSPTLKRQRNGRKTPGNKRKLSLRVLPPKAKQTYPSRVFPVAVCRTPENKIKLRRKKKRAHQREIMSAIAFHLMSVWKLTTPHDKKYFSKCLVAIIPDHIKCEHFPQKSLDTEKINYTNSNDTVRLGTIENTEHSFMVNTPELAAPCLFDLNIPKREGLSGVISESAQKDASFPQRESNGETKVQKDIQNTENGEKSAVGTADIQKCFSKGSVQNAKNSGEIILNFPGINLLISLGSQKHEENEFKDINVQVITGSIDLKEEKPLRANIKDYGNPSESEKPECDTRSNRTKRHQDERMSDTYHKTTQATVSQPFDMEMCNKLKANAGTVTINCSHAALKQEELLDGKKIQEVTHIDKSSRLRKPQEWDREAEEKRETVGPLAETFRVSICLKQKDKCVQVEAGPIQSGKRIQSPKKEAESQTISTETVWETGPCPLTNPLQAEQVKQRTDKPPDRDKAASPVHPALMPENSPAAEGLIETTGHEAPFCGKPTQTPDGQITEDKEDLKKDLCAVATGPFKVRKKSSEPKNVLGVKHKMINVKKPAFSSRPPVTARDTLNHKRKLRDSFERFIKQTLHDVTLAPVLLNVHPQGSSIPSNKTNIKTTPQKTQVEEKEKNLDSLNKESKTADTLEVQLCQGVKLVEQGLLETMAHVKRKRTHDAHPVKEIKTEKELFRGVSSSEATGESVDSLRMDSFCAANTNTSTSIQAELQYSAESELGPPASGELLTGDPLIQSRERNVPSSKNDTREISCGFTQKAFSCMSVLTHSKKKKNPTRFTNESTVRLKYMNKVKPPASKTLSTTGNKKNLKLDLKTKLKRINHAKSFLLESQNTPCLFIDRRLQGGFCHAQLKQGELASKISVESVAESRTFYNREKKRQEKQEPFVQAAPQRDQHQWAAPDQRKDTLPDEPDPSPISLSQEQPVNRQGVKCQRDSLQSAPEDSLQTAPVLAEGFQKTTKTENVGNVPVVPKNFSLEAGNSSPGEFTDIADNDLESDEKSEHELDLYPVGKESESSRSLQVTCLQSSDSVTRSFASRRKEKKHALRRSKKQITVSRQYRTTREIKTLDSQTVNFRYSNKLNHVEMTDPQQRGSITGACLEIIHTFKVYILSNKKRRKSKSRAGKQKIRRLGCMQQMREESPDGGNAQCLASIDLSNSSSMKNDEKKGEEEPECFLITQKSPPLILDVHQEKDHDLVKSDTQLNQVGRTITQVQPQTPTEVTSCSTLCPIPVEFQLEKLEDSALSERDRDLSGDRQHTRQAADSEAAQGPPASHTSPKQGGEKKCDTAKMNSRHQEEKLAAETSSLTNVALDSNTSSKTDSEKGTPSEKTPCSIQWNPEILLPKGKVPLDDIKKIDLQDKEEKENDDDTLLKPFSQESRHFVSCPHQSRDPNSQKLREQREQNIRFIGEQGIPQQSQSADLTRRECAVCTSSPKVPPMQPEESQIDEVSTDRTKYDIPADETHAQKLYSWDRLEREGLKNDLQATITESLNLLPPEELRYKRKSKVSTCKALQGKMCSTGVTMKRRKAFVSKTLNIPQCGHRNNLLPKTLKSLISELLIQSAILPDTLHIIISKNSTAEKNKRSLTQELAETMLGSLSFSTLTSKERENLEILDKGNEIINSSLTVKTRKEAISQTLIAAGCGTPKQGKPMEGSSVNVISPTPVSFDLNTCDGIKDRDLKSTMRLSCELLDQSVHKEKAWCTHYMDKDTTSNGTEDVQGQEGEEDPLTSQHVSFSAQNMTEPNSTQSGLQQINSATYPELERPLYNGQAQPVNVSTPQSNTVSVLSPLLNTEGSEIGSIPCDTTCDEGPRRKCDYAISEQKAWAEKDLTSLEPLQEPSPVSSESKCEGGTLELSGKKYISPKARQASKLLHIARPYKRVHRKNRHHKGKHPLKRDKCVEEALLYAVEDAESCPLKRPTDELSLDTAARAAFSSRIPQRSNAEEKASLSTNFLRPFYFSIPVLSDFKSQVDTVKLSENEIMLNRKFSTTKKKKISVSKIIKMDGHVITNHKKFKLRAKMKAIWLSESTTGVFQNIIHFLLTNSNVGNPTKTEIGLGVSKSTHARPTHGASLAEGIAECEDSVDKVGSNFLKDARVHAGQCWGEKQEVLTEPDPFYRENLTAGAHLMKKPGLEESKGILCREYLPQTSQTYEASPEINVKVEIKSMQVSLKEAHSGTEKPHNCPEVSESTKHGVKNTGQSSLKEKSSFYLTGIVTSIARHLIASKDLKRHMGSMRAPNLSVYKGIPSQMQSMESQSSHGYHAAVNIKKTRDSRTLEIKVDNGEVNTDMKSIYTCMPIQQTNMESSQNIWDMSEKSSKGNGLDKAQMKRKEEFAQLPHGADQKRQPGPFKSDVHSANTVHCKDMLQKTAIYLIDQEGNAKVGEEFNQEVVLSSNTHTLQIEKQNSEFKTDWKTKSKSLALPRKQEKPNVLGPTWSSYARDTTYPETIRQIDEAKIPNVNITVCAKQTKLKAKKISVRLLLRHGDSSTKKELGLSLQHQHQNALERRRNIQNLVLKASLSLGCIISRVTKLTSVKLEKGKLGGRKNILPQKMMEKPSNQRQKPGSGCVDVPRKLEENMKEAHDDRTFKDIHRQVKQFWVKSEETKEHHSCKLDNLQRKTNSELTSQKDETDNIGLATSRSREGTKVYIGPQDSLQQDYPLKQGVILQTMKEFPHFGMTNKFMNKQDIKTSSPQMIGEMEVMENPFDPKESLLIPRLMVQQQNMFTDPLPGSIPSQVPCQPHTEKPKENMKISDKLLKNSTPQLKKISNAEYISDMDHVPRSIEKLFLLIKEQGKRSKRSRGGKNFETAEDIKVTMKNPTPSPNNPPPRTQFINTMNSGVLGQRDGTEPNGSVATLWIQQRLCVQGTSLDYVYTQELTSKVIRHNKRRAAFTEGALNHKTIKMKPRKTASSSLLSVTRHGAHGYRKELRPSIKPQKELPQGKTVADLLWKDFCASGYPVSQIKKLREVKEGKGKPQRPLNRTNMLSMQPIDNNSTLSTIRKSVQYTMKQKEHQVLLLDITPRNKDQFMPGQQVEEPRHINLGVHLEKEAYRIVFPETAETDSSRLKAQRPRADTECEFLTAQRVEQGVRKDSTRHALSVPPRRGRPEKRNISSSKEHDVFLMELDTFQKETCKVQELFKQGESSLAGLENVACPFREPFHLESAKVAKEVGTDHNVNSISRLLGLRETDPELGSQAQAFLCTDLQNLHKTGTALQGHAKSGHRPRILLNSAPCHKRAPRHSKPSSSTTRKDSGASATGAKINLKGKGKAESTTIPLKLNRQKVEISKRIRAKQLIIFAQNKEQIMEFFLSCVLYKLQTENAQKKISAKAALDSKMLNPALEKAASEVKILGHSPSSEGVNLHAKGGVEHPEDACEPIPASGTHSLMDTHQITSPQVEKELKTVDNLDYHTLNTEKEEHNDRTKEQNHYHLSFSLKNLEKHLSCSYVQPHLGPHTKEAMLKVGNVSSKVKGSDLSPKAQRSTGCECRPKWILPSVILEKTKEQDPQLPLESGSKTIKCPSLLSSKKLSDGVQISKLVSNDSSAMPTVSKTELLLRASRKKQEVCLSKLFLHCFSLCLKFLHEKWKGNIEPRVMNDTIRPGRKTLNSKKLVRPHISPNDSTPGNHTELHCCKKEKMIWLKHKKDKPGSVVIKARDSIPLPHLKLNKEKSDVLISSGIRQEKHKSQEEKNGIKGTDVKGIMVSNITFKTEELSLSYPFSGKKLTLRFDSREQQGKVREGLSKSERKLKNSCISLPPLLHPNLKSRIKVEKDKSEQLKSCLPPLKPLPSLNSRKVPFSKAFSRDKLCKLIELKYAPQRKEYGNNIVHLKDRLGLIVIAQKGKTSPFKYLPHGKAKWWDNKKEPTQEEEKNTVRKDVRDKKIPKLMDQNVKKLARSHALSIKELQRETQEEKLVDQINTVIALSVSQLQLSRFSGTQIVDREVHNEINVLKEHAAQEEKEGREKDGTVNSIMRAEDIYSKAKKSPTLPMQNLNDLQRKTREQGGEVEEDGSKPGVRLTQKSSKTSVATSPQPTLTVSARIKKDCTTVLTTSSVSLGYAQNSLVSEGGIYIQQITGDTSISLQNEKQPMSEEKEEAGMQIAKIIRTHTYQETLVQELKDEEVLALTKSSPLLPDQSHPKLSEKSELNDTKLRLRNSALQRSSTEGETVPREAIVGDTMEDVKKQHISQREETDQKEIIDRRGVDVTLKLHKLLLAQKLYRTELHIHINVPKPKEQDGKSEPQVLRKTHTSQPSPTNIPLCKGVQVDEERLRSTPSSPDAEKIVDKEAVCGPVRKGKQCKKQIDITVGLTAGVHCKRTKVSPIPHLLNTKEIVLNMKFLEKKVHNGKSELALVATRSFLSLPSHPSEYSQDKTQRGTAKGTGHSYVQGNFQEAAGAQEPATRESAVAESDCIVKTTEYNVLQESKSMTRVHQISELPQVEMEYESDPQDHKIYLTRLRTIKKEKMLDMSFEGQKGQPEKCEKEPSTKIGHWEKENEFKDNLSNKTSHKFSVSPTKISLKEALLTSDTLVCSKRSVVERKQETGSGSFMTSEKDRQSNASLSKMLTPAKMSQNKEEQNVNMEEQATPQSKSGQMIKPKSSPPNVPVHRKNQRTQTDVDKKTSVTINLQMQSRVHMSTTEFNATRMKEDSPSIVPEQEQCDRALPQKSHESLLKSEHLEETNTSSDENVKKTEPEMDSKSSASQKEGALKTGVALGEGRRETQESCIVQLEIKAREHSRTTNYAIPPATEEPEIETQVGTSRENGSPPQEKLKRELELSTTKQNIQGQKPLQTNMPNSLYVYIPDCPESQKSRFAETHLKRELKPKYLTMRIPKHPISRTLGIIGRGSSSRKRKLEYAFNKPKTMVPSSTSAAGIIVRSLCVSMISPPHNEGTVELETNPRREKKVCHSEIQRKLSDARDTKDILTGIKELSKLNIHLVSKATEIKLSQIPEMVTISCRKCNSPAQRTTAEDYSCRLYLKHIKLKFTSPNASTIHDNLENNYQRDFPPFSCVKTMNVSNSSKVMTEAKGIKKQESVTSPETRSHILQKFSEKGRDNLLLHFETKALEIKTTRLPRIVAQSYAIASAQDKSKPLFTCIHSATKEQKRTNRVLVLFDEKSFCKIDHDLQCKYLRSIPRPSVPVVSKANVLPKHTYKLDVGSGSECKTAEDREESSSLLLDTDLLQHVPFQKKNPQESSFLTRKFQEPPYVLAFSAGLQGTEPNDVMIPSELKLQMTPEKDKQCHLCFQETSSYKHNNISGTQQNTADLASSHSSWISDDGTNDGPLNTETSSDLVECPASDLAESSEESDSEECVFIGNNVYSIKGSQKFLFEVPKAISLADLHRVDGATLLKSVYRDDPNDHHTRTHRKHTSPVAQPCPQSGNRRKHRLNSKMQSPDGLCHNPSNIVKIESTTSSITFSEDKHQTRTAGSRTSYSLASSATESTTKLNCAKKYGKSYMYPQVKERRKANSDLWRKFNFFQHSNYSPSHSGEGHARRKRLYHYESEEPNSPTNQMPEPRAHQENIKFYPERRENQPFFYACVPADSVDVIPQTIRWLVPSKILQKSNFHIPQVASISKPWDLYSSSKKLLGSLAGAFNIVRHG